MSFDVATSVSFTGSAVNDLVLADFDENAAIDLAVGLDDGKLELSEATGNGSFTPTKTLPIGNPRALAVGDFDANGHDDLAVAIYTSNVGVWTNDGSGSFEQQPYYPFSLGSQYPWALAAADFDGNGLDLAVGIFNDFVAIVHGEGNGKLGVNAPAKFAATAKSAIGVAALPTDAFFNLAATSCKLYVFRNGAGFPAVTPDEYDAGLTPSEIAVADLNHDENPDLVIAVSGEDPDCGSGETDAVGVFLGKADGGFDAASFYPTGAVPRALAVADFDADGKLDVATANGQSNDVSVLLGDGKGALGSALSVGSGLSGPRKIRAGDIDADGKPDLVVGNGTAPSVTILRNTSR